jgi:hypothetical protein
MNENERQQLRREECRKEVLAYLAERPGLALSADAITRGLRQYGYSLADVTAALIFKRDKGHVKCEPDADGATLYFQVTAEGTLAHERG